MPCVPGQGGLDQAPLVGDPAVDVEHRALAALDDLEDVEGDHSAGHPHDAAIKHERLQHLVPVERVIIEEVHHARDLDPVSLRHVALEAGAASRAVANAHCSHLSPALNMGPER